MEERIIEVFVTISMISVFFPLALGLIRYSSKPRYLRILWILILMSTIADWIPRIDFSILVHTANIYTIAQYVLLGLIFYDLFNRSYQKKAILLLVACFVFYSIINLVYIEGIQQKNFNLRIISGISYTVISIYYIMLLVQKKIDKPVITYPVFWIIFAVLIYFSGNIIVFTAGKIYGSGITYMYHYLIHNSLNIIKNLLFGVSFITYLKYSNNAVI